MTSNVATELELTLRGFLACGVTPRTLNINHPDPTGRGPFCRLTVDDTAPASPGVYAWTTDENVMYIGKASQLRQIVHGARMNRAANDYTYVAPSEVAQSSSPRVRVNGLLNRAFCEESRVSWWWIDSSSVVDALRLEARLIHEWRPPWNRTYPTLT